MTPVAVDCNTTAEIGQEIKKMINSTSIDEIISMDVDLIHEWYNHRNCQAEKTRISFI
jgi:protein associated with RNAse G/E